MRMSIVRTACGLALLSIGWPGNAADVSKCIAFAVNPDGAASLTNGCSDRLNMLYCIDNPDSARRCSATPFRVTTLSPGAHEPLPSYTSDGGGPVYWAVCAYPQAPIKWKPGPESAFICRKTCVMC
jgi:hypothetical protein